MVVITEQENAKTHRKLKSRGLLMLLDMRHTVDNRQGYIAACIGEDSHYFERGDCPHIWAIYDSLKSDWHRSRLWVTPFGHDTPKVRAKDFKKVKK